MFTPESLAWSQKRRVEVERLSDLSRELMRQIDAIKRRMAECTADIAARHSEFKKPDSPS
jgi:hypothetical protein